MNLDNIRLLTAVLGLINVILGFVLLVIHFWH